jgi:RNA polymerase sigma-70 factor (ECF subfamily)
MPPTDPSPVSSVADLETLAALLNQHRSRLLGMLARRLGADRRGLDPEALLQDAFLDARQKWGNRKRFTSAYAWLYRVVLDRLIDEWRRVKRRPEEGWPEQSSVLLAGKLLPQGTSPTEAAVREEKRRLVHQVLASLSENDREILAKRHLDDLSFKEIAEVLDIEVNAATVRHNRALKRFRQKWEAFFGKEDQP